MDTQTTRARGHPVPTQVSNYIYLVFFPGRATTRYWSVSLETHEFRTILFHAARRAKMGLYTHFEVQFECQLYRQGPSTTLR